MNFTRSKIAAHGLNDHDVSLVCLGLKCTYDDGAGAPFSRQVRTNTSGANARSFEMRIVQRNTKVLPGV